MRYFLYALSLGLVALMFHSCDSCFGVSCKDNENYREILRIVSARDGSDLIFGGNRLYQREKIRFFSVKGRDHTFMCTPQSIRCDVFLTIHSSHHSAWSYSSATRFQQLHAKQRRKRYSLRLYPTDSLRESKWYNVNKSAPPVISLPASWLSS